MVDTLLVKEPAVGDVKRACRRGTVVLAYAFGSRVDTVFVELKKLLKPFGLEHLAHVTDLCGATS